MMQITRTVTEHVNLGSYEWAEYSATITLDVGDDVTPQRLDELADTYRTALDRLLQPERERYQQLTTEDNSLLHAHPALTRRSTHGHHAPTPRTATRH